jgi:hypothetical protein
MSHFTQVKTKLTEKGILKKVLGNLGFQLEEAEEGVEVRGFFGNKESAEFKALTSTHYDIGFKRNETGSYEVIADWDLMPRVARIEKEEFLKKLKREYAKEVILETAHLGGYEVQCIENEETQEIEMVVTQWQHN